MATIAKLGIKLEADGSAFSSNLDQATTGAKALEAQARKTELAAKKMADEVEKAAKKAADAAEKEKEKKAKESSLGSRIESLNKSFGSESALGKIAGAFAGGAFVGGITALITGLKGAADSLKNVNKQFRDGKLTTSEYVAEAIYALGPIGEVSKGLSQLGDMAGGAILRAFDANAETMHEYADSLDEVIERQKKVKAVFEEGQKYTESLRENMESARLTGKDKELDDALRRAKEAEAKAAELKRQSIAAGGGSLAQKQYDQQRAIIDKTLQEEVNRIERAPILEKAKENAKYVEEQMKQIRKDAEQANMNDMQKTLDNLKRAGASAAEIDQAFKDLSAKKAAEEAAQAINDLKKMADEATRAAESKAAAAAEKIGTLIGDLQKQVSQFNMSDAAKAAAEVKDAGGSAAQQNAAAKLRQELDMLEKKRAVIESLETPQAKYNKQLESLNDLLNQGLLTQDEYSQAALKNLEEFKASQKTLNKVGSVGIAQVGSAEAAAALQKAGPSGGNQGQKALLEIQKKQLEYQKKQTEQNAKILAGEGIIKFTVATL